MSAVSRFLDPELVERLNHLQLTARSVVEGATIGLHKSPLKGASIEFRQHRAYVAGDEPRRLDWRVLGRTDRPYIKEYDEETNLRCVLMLDGSGSMAYAGRGQSKFEYAERLVAALAYLMLGQTESVGLALFDSRLKSFIPPRGGTSQLSRIIDTLERAGTASGASIGQAAGEVCDRLDRRALIIILSDFFSPAKEVRLALAQLRHDRHEVIAMRILDRDEQEFPFRNWSRFRGLEGERPQLCEPAVVRQTYLDNFHHHAKELQDCCRLAGGELHTLLTDVALVDSLTRFLRHRSGK